MKTTKIIIISFAIFFGLIRLEGAELEVYFMHSNFNSPTTPYLETYLSIIGNSAVYVKNENDKYQAEFEVLVFLKQGGEISLFDKYTFTSPEIENYESVKPNFIDLQRYSVSNGIYNLELLVRDINAEGGVNKFVDIIQIDYNSKDLQFSSIQLVESATPSTSESVYTKNNLDITPYVSNFYPANADKISFYIEIYNSHDKIKDDFIFRYFIEKFESETEITDISRFRRFSSQEVIPFLGELNVEKIGSGNYNLVLEVRDRNNSILLSQKLFFQRSKYTEKTEAELAVFNDFEFDQMFYGDVNNHDSLREYISSLRPIANSIQQSFIDYQVKAASKEVLQQFFYDFWVGKDPVNPNRSWMVYKEQVNLVNKSYSSFISRGYQTDRGRVYLQYGTPNSIYVSKHEPSAYPYEIWHYAEIANERNKRFVFYNPQLVGNEYDLLHSELTGEIKNPNWERLLHKRDHPIYNFDDLNSDEHWGSRARDEFRK